MAELALGITGVVIAWKGILEFGELVLQLTNVDSRRRELLFFRLQASQYRLKDWGDAWGVDRSDGRFHALEPDRKELIIGIIFKLHDSRLKALTVLKERYKLSAKDDGVEDDDGTNPESRLSRLVDRVKGTSKRLRDKGTWLAHDQAVITSLVSDTLELHEDLQYLTYGSQRFIIHAGLDARFATEAGITSRDAEGEEPRPSLQESTRGAPELPGLELDEETLASYATKSIVSATQAGRIQQQIDRAFHFHGDARIPERVSAWWNDDDQPRIMMIEAPEAADDETSELACALVYYLVPCSKLIYSFERDSSTSPIGQFVDMLRTITIRMLAMRDIQHFSGVSLPPVLINTDNDPPSIDVAQQLTTAFQQVLTAVATGGDQRILLVIDGMDCVGANGNDSLSGLVRTFVAGLGNTCGANHDHDSATIKVLMSCKGYAMALYELLGDQDVLDITDCPLQTVNIMHELAARLDESQ